MADFLSIYSTQDETTEAHPPPQRVQPLEQQRPRASLMLCADCDHPCSHYAEHCPQCGRFFQRFESGAITVSRHGWVSTIAFGILLAAVLPWLVIIAIIFLLFVMGGGVAALSR
jgi:hypothetical protein